MTIVATGSIAFDYILTFKGKFGDHILPDKTHMINLSFLVDSLQKRRGGVAGNYAYNLALLGHPSAILATAKPATLAGCRFLAGPKGLRAVREAKVAAPRVKASDLWDGRWRIMGDLPLGAEIGALGAGGLLQCADWRATTPSNIRRPMPALFAIRQ